MNIKQRKSEKKKDELRRLSQDEGNKFCFVCGVRGPLYVVTNFHIFVCSSCGAAHRSLQHKVKGISMSEFTDEEVTSAAVCGNTRAKAVWLAQYSRALPRPGQDRAIREFLSDTFERKAYFSKEAYAQLQRDLDAALHPSQESTELPVRPLVSPPHPSRQLPPPPAAPTVAPAPTPVPSAQQQPPPPRQQPVANIFEPSQTPQSQKPTDDIFDAFFSAPTPAPAPAPAPVAQPSNTATVSDLFTGVPTPAGTGAYPLPQQYAGGFHPQVSPAPGAFQPSAQLFSSGAPIHPYEPPQQMYAAYPTQQQQPLGGHQQYQAPYQQQPYQQQPYQQQSYQPQGAYQAAPGDRPKITVLGVTTGSTPMHTAPYAAPHPQQQQQQQVYPPPPAAGASQSTINYFEAPPQQPAPWYVPAPMPGPRPEAKAVPMDNAFASLNPFGGK